MTDRTADDFIDALDDVLATLTPEDRLRAIRELRRWFNYEANVHIAEIVTGALVAPNHRMSLAERLDHQARRREGLGDPTAVVWRAVAEREAVE